MKKMMKRLTVLVLAVFLLTAAAIPALAEGYDFGPAIEEFEPTPLNTISLEVGQTDKPGASLWMDNGMATAYSSDEAVATVAEDGTVTAVGEGTAYVVFCVSTLEKMYRYDVTAVKEETPVQTPAHPEDAPDAKDPLEGATDEFKDKWNAAQDAYEKAEQNIQRAEALQEKIAAAVAAIFAVAAGVLGIGVSAVGTIFFILLMIAMVVRIILLIWICIAAPKSGMSCGWSALAIVSAIAGAVVLIVIYKKRKKANTPVPAAAPVKRVCPNCGEDHGEDAKWCRNCGTKLQ